MAFMKMKKVKVVVTLILSDDYNANEEAIKAQMQYALHEGSVVVSNRGEYVAKIKVKKIEDHSEPV